MVTLVYNVCVVYFILSETSGGRDPPFVIPRPLWSNKPPPVLSGSPDHLLSSVRILFVPFW